MKQKTSREQGDLYEQAVALRVGGKVVSGSGSTKTNKEDVKTVQWLIQVKSTTKESYSLKKEDLRTLKNHSLNASRMPLFVVGFLKHGQPVEEWVAMPLGVFQILGLDQ